MAVATDLGHICLAHLSPNNNRPDLALKTLYELFIQKGIPLNGTREITIPDQHIPENMIRLEEPDFTE